MKKYLLFFTSAALLLVGCAKEQLSNGVAGELTNVTFTANLDNGVATKASADNDGAGTNVNRCIMEIYYGDTFYKRLVQPVSDKVATFANVPVVAGKQYTVLFWADCGGDNNADKYYMTNGPDSLKAVTVKKEAFITALQNKKNDELDAFFFAGNYTVKQGDASYNDIKLHRPFAQLNVITTDVAANKAVISQGLLPDKVAVKYKAANIINVATGEVSGEGDYEYEAHVYGVTSDWNAVKSRGELTLSMDYVLAAADKGAIDVEFKIKNGEDYVLTHNLTNLPYQRNYRTNVKGDLLTVGGTWTATIDADWTTPDYDVPFYSATSVSDAQNYISSTNQQKTKVVDLSKATIKTSDITGEDNKIEFKLKTTSPEELVNFTLPAIPQEVINAGCTGWKITYDEGYPTKNVNVTAPEGTKVKILAPTSHVNVTGTTYTEIEALTGDETLVIPQGVTVGSLIIKEGAVEIHGIVNALTVNPEEGKTVCFRECEGLSETVYNVLKGYIAPNYKAVRNSDNSWDIVPEDFWPNFAAAEFSVIDQSAKTLSISTPAELALLAKNINGGTSYAGYSISINGSLDMGAHYWIPINARNGQLSGSTIEGTGNAVILNLKIEKAVYSGNYDYYAGFIAQSVGALTVKDLTFSGAVSVDNGSGVATVLGLTYGNTLFDNVKVLNSTVSAATKAGALVGFTGGNNATVTVKDCALKNVTVKAEYSYALMVGLVNTNDHVVFEGNNTATNSHAELDGEVAETKTIKGYTYVVDDNTLWVIDVQDAWAECRSNPTPKKNIDGVEYSVMGDIFYHAGGEVVDVCAPDPVAQIGDTKYATLDAAFAAVQAGQTIEIIQAGSYAIPSPINNIIVKGADNLVTVADDWGTHPTVVFDASNSSGQLSSLNGVVFTNIKFKFSGSNYTGFQHQAGIVTFNNCDFEGLFNGYGNMVFNDCYFKSTTNEYVMWTYGAPSLAFNGCGFDVAGKALNVYQENSNYDHMITVTNCKFVSSTANKPALAIKNNGNGGSGTSPIYYDITITNSTFDGFGQSDGDLIGFPTDSPYVNAYGYNGATQPLKVTVDGEIRVNISK